MKILVIDTDPKFADTMVEHLRAIPKHAGADISVATNAEDGMHKAVVEKPDMVLLGVNGGEGSWAQVLAEELESTVPGIDVLVVASAVVALELVQPGPGTVFQ